MINCQPTSGRVKPPPPPSAAKQGATRRGPRDAAQSWIDDDLAQHHDGVLGEELPAEWRALLDRLPN